MGKRKLQQEEPTQIPEKIVPPIRDSDEPIIKKTKWTNKQRVLVFAKRGVTFRERHLMEDLRSLLPHSKHEAKKDRKDDLNVINEIAEMKNCNKVIYFEGRKKQDIYMWIANVAQGPSIKFEVQNAHTMREVKLTGNCLRGTRPFLSFDKSFTEPHYAVIKELLVQTFGTPNQHPKSQPFFDHVLTFTVLDDKIWFRNFQIQEEDGKLAEIGPRFVLNPIKIFASSFGGETLWANPHYITPNVFRRQAKLAAAGKYISRLEQKEIQEKTKPDGPSLGDKTNDIFQTAPLEKGKEKKLFVRKRK